MVKSSERLVGLGYGRVSKVRASIRFRVRVRVWFMVWVRGYVWEGKCLTLRIHGWLGDWKGIWPVKSLCQ